MTENFQRYSQYYDSLYAGKDYAEEAGYVDRHLRMKNTSPLRMLELGSGTGNHAQCFSALGYHITGIERSAEMAAISRAKNIGQFEVVVSDMAEFALSQRFDVAISMFHSICYLTTNEKLLSCLARVYNHLQPGGLFCFDFWNGPGVLNDQPVPRIKKVRNNEIEIIRFAQTEMLAEQNVAIVHYEIIIRDPASGNTEVLHEQHPMRYLSVPEIDLLARQTGFELVLCESFLDGKKPGLDCWNAFAMLKKID